MEMDETFTKPLIEAVEKKSQWFDEKPLPEMLEQYRLLHTCVRNIIEYLLKKSLITPDPYKNDKKISDITPLETTAFTDAERSVIFGTRISDYESNLDFLCNYYKFSVSNLQIHNIKKLTDFNNSLQWNSFSANSNNINTRTLATLLLSTKQSSEVISVSMMNDNLSKAGKAMTEINRMLKELTEFQREAYKCNIRKNVFTHPNFNAQKAAEGNAEELSQIKKLFSQAMGKIPFYNELIEEILNEDHAPNKEQLRKAVFDKLTVVEEDDSEKEEKIDTKELLLTAVRVFGAMPGQIMQAKEKIQENHDVLESEHNTIMDKLKKLLRKTFNIDEKPVYYTITVSDVTSDTRRHEKVNFMQFLDDLELRARRLNSVCVRKSPNYEKLAAQSEEKILDYVNQQMTDCQKMLKTLAGLDEFFKTTVQSENKSKIKGLKMEITALKNSVAKANQHRSEYTAYIEEEAQFKKLGITNA